VSEKRDFFISYNKNDKQWAKWIAAVLEQSGGYTCYIQAWDFRKGGNFVLDMQKALVNSERAIAVLSPSFMDSEYCQAEWAVEFTKDPASKNRLLIPVRVYDFKPEGLFASITYIDLVGVEEKEAEKQLLNGVDTNDIPRPRPIFPGTSSASLPAFPGAMPGWTPSGMSSLPFMQNQYFTGRDKVFEDICVGFESGKTIALTQTLAGMGGLGKTQTALEYVYRYAYKYKCVWWVMAETESTVLASYKNFATKMGLIPKEQQDDELILQAVLDWMDSESKWLFIYDNVNGISASTPWLPRNNRGNILITTRSNHVPFGKRVDIDVFTEEEAIHFLESRTGLDKGLENAAVLAKRLGYLPLALEQAAAYIQTNGDTYVDYIYLLESHGLKVLDDMYGVNHYDKPLAVTMEISIEKINKDEARDLLYLCAYMAPEDIDDALFRENAELLPMPLSEALKNRLIGNEAWRQLTQYSLLKRQDDGNGYSMHRLLQEVVRNKIGLDKQWALSCLSLFRKIYYFEYGDIVSRDSFISLTPHVEAFLNNAIILTDDEDKKGIANLYHKGGFGFSYQGHYKRAQEWYKKALDIIENVLGIDHPSTATTYNNIASVYNSQGEYAKALEWYKKALDIIENVLGKDHPYTATTYNNIALAYSSQGEYAKALEWNNKALDIREKVLGEDHPDTATTYNNIGVVYSSQREYVKALEWNNKALYIREKVLGKDHPDTATTYNNIALVYSRQGEYAKALEWNNKALYIREKVLGKDHPDTATTYNNIAGVYESQRDYAKAQEWHKKALDIREKVLGKDHPDTATIYSNIAFVYYYQGEYTKAQEEFEKALAIKEKMLGPEHPSTIITKEGIEAVYYALNTQR